jgi:hypothetical protein
MKFILPVKCSQGHEFKLPVYDDEDFPVANCPHCEAPGYVVEQLTMSRGGDRLLHRSKAEMDAGDFTLSIICSAVAVECFLTRAFLKWKGVENIPKAGHLPTEAEESVWEKEFPRSGGFPRPADFVSKALVGMSFDDFVAKSPAAQKIMNGFPAAIGTSTRDYFQATLFEKRNRIMHWGHLNYGKADAQLCHQISLAATGILKIMDHERYSDMEKSWRQSQAAPTVAI